MESLTPRFRDTRSLGNAETLKREKKLAKGKLTEREKDFSPNGFDLALLDKGPNLVNWDCAGLDYLRQNKALTVGN